MVNLVSLETLKREYGFDLNTDQEYILPNIYKGQKFIIKPVLGPVKYKELEDYIESVKTGATKNPDNEELIGYIADVLAYYVKSEIVFNTAYKIKNQNTNPDADRFNELVKISKKYQSDSDAFLSILRQYLCENNIILPEKKMENGNHKSQVFLGYTPNNKSAFGDGNVNYRIESISENNCRCNY